MEIVDKPEKRSSGKYLNRICTHSNKGDFSDLHSLMFRNVAHSQFGIPLVENAFKLFSRR